MESSGSSRELQNLLEAIKTSEVVEGRAELIAKLADLHLSAQSDLKSLVESLITFWEDYTCLDVSQCMLNKTVLHVAARYLNSDISRCLLQFLLLATKASIWCGKHLKMSVMSTEDSPEEEHCSLFYQLLLDFLSFSASSLSSMTRYSILTDKASMEAVEKSILEQLNLTKDAISEIKNIHSNGLEVLKAAQEVINAVIKLCKEYSQLTNQEFSGEVPENDENGMDCEQPCITNHIMNIMTVVLEKLLEMGIFAANHGGSLVTILNVSWKGVITLLQVAKDRLPVKVNVADIVVTLISLVNGSLKCSSEAWSSSLKEPVSITEARRIFVPIKFYLINAAKICSLYPCKAFEVYKDITHCVLMISTFKLLASHENLMKNVSEVMTELLEKTSLDLLNSLLNSTDLKQELKYEILEWYFFDNCWLDTVNENHVSKCRMTSMVEIFSVSCEAKPKSRALLLGRVALFSSFLKYSFDLEEDVKLLFARKLDWFMNIIIVEEVYSSILVQIPVLYVSGKTVELTWEQMFSAVLNALKTFMIVVSSTLAWEELASFLVKNFLHPHFLCSEIIMELWCFLVQHAEMELVNDIIFGLCALVKLVATPEAVFIPGSNLRKMASSVCMLLSFSSTPMVDCFYSSMVGDDRSQLSSVLYAALLLEGFPLNLLSENMRSIAKEKIITDYFGFIDNFDKSLIVSSSEFGIPVFVLSSSLQSLQVTLSDADMKTLKFVVAIVCAYRNSVDKLKKERCCKLLSQTLGIISNLSHLYGSEEMEVVILEIHNLFVSETVVSDTPLHLCKPGLALFVAGLSNMGMLESGKCAKSTAVWQLYHMLLRERHWALIHLSIAAFGYFAARTNCNQLWRFVPPDAALSYDLESGDDVNEERFMSEFKAFLEKEMALPALIASSEQQEMLLEDGILLKEKAQKILNRYREDSMEIDDDKQSNKRRKLPGGIKKGVELLQDGLKIIRDSLTQWQPNHIESAVHDSFLTHFSSLENQIVHLMSLFGSD